MLMQSTGWLQQVSGTGRTAPEDERGLDAVGGVEGEVAIHIQQQALVVAVVRRPVLGCHHTCIRRVLQQDGTGSAQLCGLLASEMRLAPCSAGQPIYSSRCLSSRYWCSRLQRLPAASLTLV